MIDLFVMYVTYINLAITIIYNKEAGGMYYMSFLFVGGVGGVFSIPSAAGGAEGAEWAGGVFSDTAMYQH